MEFSLAVCPDGSEGAAVLPGRGAMSPLAGSQGRTNEAIFAAQDYNLSLVLGLWS